MDQYEEKIPSIRIRVMAPYLPLSGVGTATVDQPSYALHRGREIHVVTAS